LVIRIKVTHVATNADIHKAIANNCSRNRRPRRILISVFFLNLRGYIGRVEEEAGGRPPTHMDGPASSIELESYMKHGCAV
jgi:hypothetical protein